MIAPRQKIKLAPSRTLLRKASARLRVSCRRSRYNKSRVSKLVTVDQKLTRQTVEVSEKPGIKPTRRTKRLVIIVYKGYPGE
jgi:hypothetical protein